MCKCDETETQEPIDEREQIRGKNLRLARLIANLREVHAFGPRLLCELAITVAERLNGLPLLEELAQRYAGLDLKILRALGATDFAAGPVRVVAGTDQHCTSRRPPGEDAAS